MTDHVARIRALMREAVPVANRQPQPSALEAAAVRSFQLHEFNSAPAPTLVQTKQARFMREILRIARWYNWGGEIDRALDQADVGTLDALPSPDLLALRERMVMLEQCAQDGCDPPDMPAAR